jgi:protein-disulfide isomerase
VSYSFIHYPLNGHTQARADAYAAYWANGDGRFEDAVNFILGHQDSLGKRPWEWFANGAGVRNANSFNRCMADSLTTPAAVRSGIELGKKIGVVGTPTVILNGWRYAGVPSDTELARAVDDLLAGRKPYKGFPAKALRAH